MSVKGTLRICDKGHQYYKSSDCPICPVCEVKRNQKRNFFLKLVLQQDELSSVTKS
jgi:hypothetical protein